MAAEKSWVQGCVSSAVLVELEKMAGTGERNFHTFCEEEIVKLLPKREKKKSKICCVWSTYLM